VKESGRSGRSFPLVLAGPSGGGKTSVRQELLERRDDMLFSVSATTRTPRPGERDGVDYRFLSRERFEELVTAGEFLEWAEVHGELYGTPGENLRQARLADEHLLLDIDVQGVRQLRKVVPEVVTVFMLPPSLERLLERLRGRGSEDAEATRRRMRTAQSELAAVPEFGYVVVNDVLEDTVNSVEAIISAEKSRVGRPDAALEEQARGLSESLNRLLAEPASRMEKVKR
jgi:guanylate kinase